MFGLLAGSAGRYPSIGNIYVAIQDVRRIEAASLGEGESAKENPDTVNWGSPTFVATRRE